MLLKNVLLVTLYGVLTIITTHCHNAGNYTIGAQEIGHNSNPFFVVVVPSYNNKDYYIKNLDSIFMQDYDRYHVIYTDDASPDGTGQLVKKYVQDNDLSDKITLLQNKQRTGALANTYTMAHLCHPKSIIVIVDGDDWLAHSSVLSYLASIYKNKKIWLTYGQYQWFSSCHLNGCTGVCKPIPNEIIHKGNIRQYQWVTSHLRTFYAKLFHIVNKDDLLYEDNFFSTAGDLAYMFPMLEMAGFHIKCISDILYIYNFKNSINDEKINLQLQQRYTQIIRNKKKYPALQSLLFN